MPLQEMSLNELLSYQGSSPCPTDIMEYWDHAKEEMHATDPKPVWVKANFEAKGFEFYDLYFKGVRNGHIHCRFIKPEKIISKAPAVIKFHGYADYCGEWSSLLSYAALGYVVCAMDTRGQGGLSGDWHQSWGNTLNGHIIRGLSEGPENLFFRQVYLDTAMVAEIVMSLDYVDEKHVSVIGASQGGALAVACASLSPEIYKAGFQFPFLCDYYRAWKLDGEAQAYTEIKQYFRMHDSMHKDEAETFMTLGYIDLQNLAKWIKAECLMCTGLSDTVCPPSTQFAMYNKISAKKSYQLFPDFGHEPMKGADDLIMQFIVS